MKRYFTRDQAQALLPEAERLLRGVRQAKQRQAEADAEIDKLMRDVMASGGKRLEPSENLARRARRDGALNEAKEQLQALEHLGIQVKDVEMGLLDFPTMYRGQEVLLCWRLGEPAVEWWHSLETGIRGRKRIDPEFLANHSGSDPH